jgi:hypothetical protein
MPSKFHHLRTSAFLTIFCLTAVLHAQPFPSGSTGADGDLIVNTPGVTVFNAQPVGGGNIYNFKTIQIAAGSTLRLSGAVFAYPLYFLAQGAVTVAGVIDLSGQNGFTPVTSAQRTAPTVPGPGGFSGGSAAFGGLAALTGFGPLGGTLTGGCNNQGGEGGFPGTQFLVPLVGGSGGAGNAANGGAGGGALLIASSVSITVTGTITAAGGHGSNYTELKGNSGGGSGGGIRLVSPILAGTGTITAAGGFGVCNQANSGNVRVEAFQYSFTGTIGGNFYSATPVNLFLPAVNSQPKITVTSIGGIAVPSSPTGSFVVPDVLLNSTSPLTVTIQANNVPVGTVPTVHFSTQNFPDQTITAGAGLAGTAASSSTTATVTLNPGYSIGFVTATWVQ